MALVQPAIVVTAPIEPDADASDEPILPDRIAPAFKAPTSGGSTGRPKIIVSGQNGTTDPDTPFSLGGRVRGQTELVAGPLYHNGPFVFSVPGLLSGGHLVVMPRFDASEALELIERYRVEWMMLVPTMMLRIWRLPEAERLGRDVSSLRGRPAPRGAVPRVAEARVDQLAGRRRDLGALRRHRGAGRHAHHRRRVARSTKGRSAGRFRAA